MKSPLLARAAALLVATTLLVGCSRENKVKRQVERAKSYFASGAYDEAAIEFANVLRSDAENLTAIEHLGLIWSERGAPMRALPFWLKVRSKSPGNLDIQHRVLQITLSLGKLAEARTEATAILQRFPADKEAIVILARAARSPEDFEAVAKALQKGDRSTAAHNLAAANLLLRRGDAAGAKNLLQRALILEPKSPQVRSALAAYHLWLNNTALAGPEFKAAAELAPLRSNDRIRYADFLMQTGATVEAAAFLKEMVAKAPDYLPAWRGLAYVALAEKKYDDALGFLAKVFSRDPANYESQIMRAQVWLAKGDTKRAIAELESIGTQFPGIAEDKYMLGRAYVQNNDPTKAIIALKKAVSQNPDHVDALLLLARLTLATGDAKPVALAMMELLGNQPNLMSAQMLLVDAMRALGRLEAVAEGIREQIKDAPERAALHRLLGLVLNQQQKTAEARKSLERSLELTPDSLPVVAELIAMDLKEKNFGAALKRVERQIAKTPDLPSARLLEAKVFAAEGKWNEAESVVLKTLEMDANAAGAYDLLASSFLARGKSPQAVRRVDDFLAKRPKDLSALVLGGYVYAQLEEFQKACGAYERYLAAKPGAPVVLNNLAYLYSERLGQSDRGLELARQGRKADSNSPVLADTLGWILFQRKEYPEALALFKESVAKMPNNPEYQFHLGLASQSLGQNDAARTAFQQAANSTVDFPGKEGIKQRLLLLEEPTGRAKKTPPAEPKAK